MCNGWRMARTLIGVAALLVCSAFASPYPTSLGGQSANALGRTAGLSAVAGAQSFAPAGLSSLNPLIAYDARSLSLTNGDPISAWASDGSVSGADLSNAGAASTKATYVTGAGPDGSSPVARFDGGDTEDTAAGAFALQGQPFTHAIILKLSVSEEEWGGSVSTTNNWGVFDYAPAGGMCFRFGAAGVALYCHATARPTVDAWELITIQANGASSEICVSGDCDTGDGGSGSFYDFAIGSTAGVGLPAFAADVAYWGVFPGVVEYADILAAAQRDFPGFSP